MENHPIPQDVTGFQFKLIGQMTVKQFAFVGSGVAMSYISYVLPLSFLFRFPLIFLFAGTGLALAFLPIDGRPLDAMLIHFFTALFSPNQYLFEKVGGQFPATSFSDKQTSVSMQSDEKRLQTYLQALSIPPKNDLDKKEQAFFSLLNPQPAPPIQPSPEKAKEEASRTAGLPLEIPHVVAPPQTIIARQETPAPAAAHFISSPQEEKVRPITLPIINQPEDTKPQQEEKAELIIPQEIKQSIYEMAHEKALELKSQLQKSLKQKQELEQQNQAMQKKLQTPQREVFAPSEEKIEASVKPRFDRGISREKRKPTPNLRKVTQAPNIKTGVPRTPDAPNLITGIIKDPRGNVLPQILVEIKDAEENPVRAFKTNPLGQFASATPLSNGTYTVTFEDPTNAQKFEALEIDVIGEIIQPLEIFSIDEREELRKTLFSQ